MSRTLGGVSSHPPRQALVSGSRAIRVHARALTDKLGPATRVFLYRSLRLRYQGFRLTRARDRRRIGRFTGLKTGACPWRRELPPEHRPTFRRPVGLATARTVEHFA